MQSHEFHLALLLKYIKKKNLSKARYELQYKKSNVKKINNCARIHFANKTFYYLMFNQIIILIYLANACFQN